MGSAGAVISFWQEAGPAKWFAHDAAFDAAIHDRFESLHHAAARGALDAWMESWEGSLALLLLLDQFPRNLFRGSAHSWATDPLAKSLAERALDAGHDILAPAALRVFYYLPFEHSEDLADQDRCMTLCGALDAASGSTFSNWATLHRDIIARFGRFPHRNAALGRVTTPQEQSFLDSGGFAG
ncbi:DUF924 family protein [Novosphingobium sp.]|uniref:DUF924 family protein n=1 Tax=Novosphingobium sp. TaxID=1874826 RepID=UPI00286A4C63|nr:DUF924 family protein [Novosphingobium sp.]